MPSRLTVVLVSFLLASPVVISWLWLVIIPLRVTKLCPEECQCDVAGYDVTCSNQSQDKFPSFYLTHVEKLTLFDYSVISLENDSFISKGLTELYILAIVHCGLQTIEFGAFNGLTNLIHLSMPRNGIEEITRRTFEKVSGLELLGLQNNKIENLDVDVFSELINLQRIYLDGNKLLKLHPDLFVGLHKLEHLSLSSNEGLQIPNDRHLIISHSLKFLDISHCNVSSVSVETFAKVSALETLHLNNNNLKSIDIYILESLPKLSEIFLISNPLQCDCQLKQVLRLCQDHDIYLDNMEYTGMGCEGKVISRWVSEESHCDKDNISSKFEYKQKRNKIRGDKLPPEFYDMIYIFLWIYTLFSIFGTIGNVIILIIILCNKDMRNVSNMYFLNLAISDLIFITLPFAHFIKSIFHFNTGFSCTFFTFCYRLSVGLSGYSVAVLSFKRYSLIVNPFHVRVSSQPTWRGTVSTICGVWILAALFAIPSALSNFQCPGLNSEGRYIAYHKHVFTFELLVFCVLPVFAIALFYIMTARRLVQNSDLSSEESQNPQLNQNKNFAKYVMGLTVVFMISYVPYHAFWAYFFFNSDRKIPLTVFTIFHIISDFPLTILIVYFLFLINSSLNPVALICTGSLFRKHLKRCLCCCCKANSPSPDIELTRIN
jgi:hypothetical protein